MLSHPLRQDLFEPLTKHCRLAWTQTAQTFPHKTVWKTPEHQRLQHLLGLRRPVTLEKMRLTFFDVQSVTTSGTGDPDSAALRVTANCRYPH